MKAVSLTVAAATALALATVPVAAEAQASARHCANRADYRKVHNGQSVAKVAKLLHGRGHVEAHASFEGYRSVIRTYRTCSEYSALSVSFSAHPGRALRVDAKSAVWIN